VSLSDPCQGSVALVCLWSKQNAPGVGPARQGGMLFFGTLTGSIEGLDGSDFKRVPSGNVIASNRTNQRCAAPAWYFYGFRETATPCTLPFWD
jgi:hypothetical protein